jgi:hypothetical protein
MPRRRRRSGFWSYSPDDPHRRVGRTRSGPGGQSPPGPPWELGHPQGQYQTTVTC